MKRKDYCSSCFIPWHFNDNERRELAQRGFAAYSLKYITVSSVISQYLSFNAAPVTHVADPCLLYSPLPCPSNVPCITCF